MQARPCALGWKVMQHRPVSTSSYLGVGIENHGARRLYERLGYRSSEEMTRTTYQYFDDAGQKQWATETDDVFGKALRTLPVSESTGVDS